MSTKPKDNKNRIRASKTVPAQAKKLRQGRMRWSFEYKDGKVMDKYNGDGTRNLYQDTESPAVLVPLTGVSAAALTDPEGNVVAVMDVPDGAKVFQRRRSVRINYYNRWHDVPDKVPESYVDGVYYPERKFTRHVPEITYDQVWLIGWRKSDGSLRFKAVYRDGKVDEYTAWGLKPWLSEPAWFAEEQV